jgi:hypothetical protein
MRDMKFLLSAGLLAAVVFSSQPAASQSLTFPILPAHPRTSHDLVPPGWQIDSQAVGDLNGDGLPDKALVLLRGGKPIEGDDQLIVVATGRSDGSYDVAIQNHGYFYREVDPDRSYSVTPVIARGTLRLRLDCGCGGSDGMDRLTLRWQQGRFYLIGYDYNYASRGSTEDGSIDYLTGVARIGEGHVTHGNENDPSHRSRTVRFTPKKLLTFDEIDWNGSFQHKQLCSIGVKPYCY